jgi:alpha-1,2-mannosyltransferase
VLVGFTPVEVRVLSAASSTGPPVALLASHVMGIDPAAPQGHSFGGLVAALRTLLPWLLWLAAPLALTASGLAVSLQNHPHFGGDFHAAFWPAGHRVLHGLTPYVDPSAPQVARATAFVYPAPAAVLFAPFALIGRDLADALFVGMQLVAVALTLRLLAVRDWRVYGAAYLWAAVASGWLTGNVTLMLVLAVAAAWRWRRRPAVCGALVGLVVAFKLFLWPLGLWLLATRRIGALGWAVAVTLVLSLVGWAVLGFAELHRYERLVQALVDALQNRGYTLMSLTRDLSLGRTSGYAVAVAVGAALALWALVAGRRGRDAQALTLSIAIALLVTPLVWLHYFALFLVPVAIVSPRLSRLWVLPWAYWLCVAGARRPETWQLVVALATTAALVAMLLDRSQGQARTVRLDDAASPAAT